MPVTSPDSIYFSDTSAPADINAVSASEATSVQAAFALRQRYEFVWANAAARTAQTGMTTGSTGYQVDTKAEYIYESATWRLKTSYAEYTHPSQSSPNSTGINPVPFTLNSSLSTDSTFTSSPGGGAITFTQAGIYSLSWFITMSGAPGAAAFGAIYSTAARLTTDVLSLSGFTQVYTTTVLPFYRISAPNTSLYFQYAQYSGGTLTASSVLRIGRLG